MTVIATLLAGLASSEMTRAQYDRSLAAQRQSKAGDQWGFFQSKRLRAVMLRGTIDLMVPAEGAKGLDGAALRRVLGSSSPGAVDSPAGHLAIAALTTGALPRTAPAPKLPDPVSSALSAIDSARPDEEVARRTARTPSARPNARRAIGTVKQPHRNLGNTVGRPTAHA